MPENARAVGMLATGRAAWRLERGVQAGVAGTYQDFARSGISDFGAFVMSDLFGGTFFHLLLGGLAGALLGMIGGALTVGVTKAITRSSGELPNARLHPAASSADEGG